MKQSSTGVPLYTPLNARMFGRAYRLLSNAFTSGFRTTYLRGKTELRDFLYKNMSCSLLEAEMLVDSLEKERRIEFIGLPNGLWYGEWNVR